MLGAGGPERGEHDRAGDPVVTGQPQDHPGVVIQPAQDLGVGAGAAVAPGQPVVGEVGLSALVGQLGGKAQAGRLGPVAWLGDD